MEHPLLRRRRRQRQTTTTRPRRQRWLLCAQALAVTQLGPGRNGQGVTMPGTCTMLPWSGCSLDPHGPKHLVPGCPGYPAGCSSSLLSYTFFRAQGLTSMRQSSMNTISGVSSRSGTTTASATAQCSCTSGENISGPRALRVLPAGCPVVLSTVTHLATGKSNAGRVIRSA